MQIFIVFEAVSGIFKLCCLYLKPSVKYLHSKFLRTRPTVCIVAVSVSLLRV